MKKIITLKWLMTIGAGIMTMLVNIDVTIVNLAIPSMTHYFHATISQTQWIVSLYLLGAVASFMMGGHLADIYGKKRMFIIGSILFTVASAVIAAANTLELILVMRFVQGLGFALVLNLAIAITAEHFPTHQQGLAIGTSITISGVSQALGPTLGGIILSVSHWPMIFLINVPLGILSIAIVAYFYKPEFSIAAGKKNIFRGFIDPSLLKIKSFNIASVMRMIYMIVWSAVMFSIPIYLQWGLGFNAMQAGLTILCMTGLLAITSPITGKLIDRFGAKPLIMAALIFALLATLFFIINVLDKQFLFLIVGLILFGISIGLMFPSSIYSAMQSLPTAIKGKGMGLYFTLAFSGSMLGVLVASYFFNSASHDLLSLLIVNVVLIGVLLVLTRVNLKKVNN